MENYNWVWYEMFIWSIDFCDPDVLKNWAAIKDMCLIPNTIQRVLLNLQVNTICGDITHIILFVLGET